MNGGNPRCVLESWADSREAEKSTLSKGSLGAPGSKQKTEPYFLRPVNRRPDDLHPGIMYIREECVVSQEIDVEPTIFLLFSQRTLH